GVPADTLAHDAPKWTTPTEAGTPLTVFAPKATVGGTAEAMANVDIFRNGQLAGTAQATKVGAAITEIPLNETVHNDFAVSPVGSKVAFSSYVVVSNDEWIAVQDLSTGTVVGFWVPHVSLDRNISFSPDGTKLAVEGF